MRHLRLTLAAVVAFALAPAPATAAERGTIRGVVINETTGRPQRGVEITLTGGRSDGSERETSSATTDARGRYRFRNLPTGDDRFYVVDARYRGGFFPGSPVSLPATTSRPPVIETRLKVWETTKDPETILLARDNVFLTRGEGGVDVIESVTIANLTEHAYIGRGTDPGAPSVSLPLPGGARRGGAEVIDSDLDIPELVTTETGLGLTVAIPPGEWRITYAYRVPGSAGNHDLSRVASYPVVQASVHAAEGIDIASNRLVSNGQVTIGGVEYRRWSATEAVEAGESLQIAATVGGAPATGRTALAAAAAVAALLVVATVWRNRRPRRVRRPRDEVLREVAELDIRHDRGELARDEWKERRADLIAELDARGSRR